MRIHYLSPGTPDTISGGTRKLYDHVAILEANGYDAQIVHTHEVGVVPFDPEKDVVVVPEVYGDGIRDFVPAGWRRIVFVQNSYITERVDGHKIVSDPNTRHPYMTTPELIAIFTESAHTTDRLRHQFPDLKVPLIRTHSSGNGRNGESAGFEYGPWPREAQIVYFAYKHEADNAAIFDGLDVPNGWQVRCMTGLSDPQIAQAYRDASIFVAANRDEGMCAPTSEAMISGAVIVCWTGGGPDEYLVGRSVIAPQDDVQALRRAITDTARDIDKRPRLWAQRTRDWSDWFCETYSREREIEELCDIFDCLA